jgi:hypothetical protein
MLKTNKKKLILSLAIILGLLIVIALPVLLQNTPTAFPPQPNTLANTQTTNQITSKANPQPQPNLWWNHSWNYRIEVNVTEQGYAERVNEIAQIRLNFTDGHCAVNSTRVLYYNHSTKQWVEVPIQIENLSTYASGKVRGYDLLFLCNVTKSGTSTYYVYYNDTYTGSAPTYTTPLNITIDPTGIHYFLFETGVIGGWYNLRTNFTKDPDTGLFFDDDACFRIFRVNGVNIIPTTGLHSGFDRIDADDLYRWNYSGDTPRPNQLNWTAVLLESGPLRAVVSVYKTSTDKFTWTSNVNDGNYTGMNKTFTFYAYQGYVKINIVNTSSSYNTVPIWDFAVVNITSQWTLYVDTYNLGPATSWAWTDKISSPQPFNHMSLVRNDGIGLALLGSPLWPEDEHGSRTSVEFGYGDIEGHNAPGYGTSTKSFLIRNDGRTGDPQYGEVEYRIKIPFTYYIAGLTQGFNQTINTWYQVNNPTQTNNGTECNKFYPLVVNVTDWFYNPISGANVSVYDEPALSSINKTGITNSQGLCDFLLNLNYTTDQYWIQAYQNNSYENYTSEAKYWNPVLNFTYPYSTVNIRMNITTVYVEVWDSANHRLQNATVTLDYTDTSLTDISQIVDEFYANCTFYAWSNQYLNINQSSFPGEETKIYILFPNGTKGAEVTPPIYTNEPKRFRVEVQKNITASPTQLWSNVTILNKFWKDNVTFYVWLKAGEPPSIPIYADWINFTIYDSSGGIAVPAINMTLVEEGLYFYTFNTSTVGGIGLFGGETYTIRIQALTNSSYVNPTPISIFLPVQNLNITPGGKYGPKYPIDEIWSEHPSVDLKINIYLFDTRNNLWVDNANVTYTITGTKYVNQIMEPLGIPGYYRINDSVVDDLIPGNFTIIIVSSLQNYTIQDYYIPGTIKYASGLVLVPSTKIQGSWNENISLSVGFVRAKDGTPITGASVSWMIQGLNVSGTLTDPDNIGNYSGQIESGTLTSGSYVLIIAASKENYQTNFTYLSLEIIGAQAIIGSMLWLPQLFGGPSDCIFAGPLVQVENSWTFVPVIFTYMDSNGNPIPNATITVTGGLPVFDIGSGTIKGVGTSEVRATQLGGGIYLVLVPISGLPPATLPLSIVAQALNYQTQQTPIVISIKEKTIALAPGIRVPVSTFLLTVAAIALPTGLFLTYTFIKRARIPYIIKRIDELIKAISRGEKVTVKLIPRDKVIGDILREELAIVGVEPRVEKYIPVEIADLIVPLLVESGMKEKEAYAMTLELKTAAPAQREKLLESVGIPGETTARIIQTIEEYEEKQAQAPIRKPRRKEAVEEPTVEEERPTEEEKPTEEETKEDEWEYKEPDDT